MFITLFFISFSFLQTACFLLNNIQQQKQYEKQTNIEFLLSNKYMTRQTKNTKKQIYKYQIENIVKRLAEHPPCIHLAKTNHMCTKYQTLGAETNLQNNLLNLNLNFECSQFLLHHKIRFLNFSFSFLKLISLLQTCAQQ